MGASGWYIRSHWLERALESLIGMMLSIIQISPAKGCELNGDTYVL